MLTGPAAPTGLPAAGAARAARAARAVLAGRGARAARGARVALAAAGALCAALTATLTATGTAAAYARTAPERPEVPRPAAEASEVRERQRWVLDAINAERAWTVAKGAGVTVALIDSGVDTTVPELRGRVTTGPDMTTGTVLRSAAPPGGHGTAMASLIAGSGAGGGLLGAAPEARVLSLRLTKDQPTRQGDLRPTPTPPPGRDSKLARAIRYATDRGAKVINMSLGVYTPDRSEREAVSYAISKGVVLVAAAGNDGKDGQEGRPRPKTGSVWNYPAGYSGVIAVSSVDRQGRPAAFANDNLSVLVAAPGVDIPVAGVGGRYGTSRGTSASAALVAGVAALVKSRYPDLRPELVARAMASGTRGRPEGGYDDRVGFGTVDAAAVLARAGELAGRGSPAGVSNDRHFGGGPPAEPHAVPGPDPLKMWVYAAAVVFGLAAFAGTIVVLTRRSERDGGPGGGSRMWYPGPGRGR
ncbi:type VII secretion-associated serine protease mycosin [Sinosporangium album]|uniref:Type VII secretion-associated serine protease mycosin n=1 Tax=Sinosporangium album TaxID=504805 RepID=A0A1G7Y955_9ACTN|nr:S8 family serine peptidase [Sinosporangium album]SDG92863.1 type VII secretion-associated serine protease mycosin [Sinosporangium album]